MSRRLLQFLSLGLLIMGLTGCLGTSPRPVYYTLRPIESPASSQLMGTSDRLSVGIGPIKFPDELNRPSIVTRSGRNRLEVNEFHRWGGSLEKNVTRVIEENLALLLKTDRVMARPWERYFQPDIRIALDFRQFDGRLGEYATINATWMVIGPEEDAPLVVRRTIIQETASGDGYDALVDAQSRALAGLCRDIARGLAEHLPAQ